MSSRVGSEGSILIDKAIRDRLGVEPGWEAVQILRDGHVEIHFLPPVRAGSSAGILAPVKDAAWLESDDALHEATERAFEEALRERFTGTDAAG